MFRKRFSLNNPNKSRNYENYEEKRNSNSIFQSKKLNKFSTDEDVSDNKNNFKNDYEIQNNSIIDEDEYNGEIYNKPISSFKNMFNDENDDYKYKSKFSLKSFKEKSKIIFLFKSPKKAIISKNHERNSLESNSGSNYSFQDSSYFLNQESKSHDIDSLIFIDIINNFEKICLKLANIKNKSSTLELNNKANNIKRRYNIFGGKIISRFSVKNRKKMFSNNYYDIDIKDISTSQSLNGFNNKRKNIFNYNKKIKKEILITEPKEDKNLFKNNNLKSIVKNIFNKNFPEVEDNKDKDETKERYSFLNLGLNKKIFSNSNNKVINSQVNNNHAILNDMNYNSRIKYKNNSRKSKSMNDENSHLDENNDNNKKEEKYSIFPNTTKNNISSKKVNYEDDIVENEKKILVKRIENYNNRKTCLYSNKKIFNKEKINFNKNYDNLYSNNNYNNNKEKNDSDRNYSFLYSKKNINKKEINYNNFNNKKYNKDYIFSNSYNNKDKDDSQINDKNNNNNNNSIYRKTYNKNNENYENNNHKNRRHNADIISPITVQSQKPIIKDKMINYKENNKKNRIKVFNRINNNNSQISTNQQKPNEKNKIKIEKSSTQVNGPNFFPKFKNINYDNYIDNSKQIRNLKNQSNYHQNNDKISSNNETKKKLNLINCRSCFFKKEKIELFKNDYNLNQSIANLNYKFYQKHKNINGMKKPISLISSSKTDDKTTYLSKNEEISTERTNHTKLSITIKNDGEKYIINNNKSYIKYNFTNTGINNKEEKSRIKTILTNTTNNSNYNENYNKNSNKKTIYLGNNKFLNEEETFKNKFQRLHHKIHEIKSISHDKNEKINTTSNINDDKFNDRSKNKCHKIITSTSMENIKILRRSINANNLNKNNINITETNKEDGKNNENNFDKKIINTNNLFRRYKVKKN